MRGFCTLVAEVGTHGVQLQQPGSVESRTGPTGQRARTRFELVWLVRTGPCGMVVPLGTLVARWRATSGPPR